MYKAKKLCALLGVLLLVCIAAYTVSRYEEKKEQIKNSGEVILGISTEDVKALSWENENGAFSFTKEASWSYDADNSFPVDADKINALLAQFEAFSAAFTIDEVEDYVQYGLDEPVCKISISTGDVSYNIELGDYSKMDEQRYVSIGDGKVYLATHDPLEEYDAVLSEMILNDVIPEFEAVNSIQFSGAESYTITYNEDGKSICEEDVYFSDESPLDTEKVDSLLSALKSLGLTEYASYNASEEELASFGMNEPDLSINAVYRKTDDDNEADSFRLDLSQSPKEAAAYKEAVENDEAELPSVSCYARLNGSQIVYKISQSAYEKLTAVSFDELRHQKLFTADFDTVTSVDITLDGKEYSFTCVKPEDEQDTNEEKKWTYDGEEFDIFELETALRAIAATSFTTQAATGQAEISLTVHMDNEEFPSITLTLYRYDGADCVAELNGNPIALVSRAKTVALIEAVNAVILGI